MASKRNLPQERPQDRPKHPGPWQDDLNPAGAATRTAGARAATAPATRPASEIKDVVRTLEDFTRDELEHVPVIEPGARLRPRAVYVDLADPKRRPFRALNEAFASEDAFYVAKKDVARPFWNRLLRLREPERDRGVITRADRVSGPNAQRRPPRTREGQPRARSSRLRDAVGAKRPRGDSMSRTIPQGENERRGGRERSERRGAEAAAKPVGMARHRHARKH
jgi:hypothetical protein